MSDKMTIEQAKKALNLYNIEDQEERMFIIDSIRKKPMHIIVDMIVQLSKGRTIGELKEEFGIQTTKQENDIDER